MYWVLMRRGGHAPIQVVCDEFVSFTNTSNLIHRHANGVQHTWSNGRAAARHMEVRIDRIVHNTAWLMMWLVFFCKL